MRQKVEFIQGENIIVLQNRINDFAKTHHIENISYAVSGNEVYNVWHYCCVLYTDDE